MCLSENQLEIITGSLLGDGCLRVKNRGFADNATFVKTQSRLDKLKQDKASYLEWHFDQLKPLSSSIGFYSKRQEYEYRTKSHEVFTELEKIWYLRDGDNKYILNASGKRIKIVPKSIKLTPLSLCIWFMDDGTNYPKKRQAEIATLSFTKEENDFLVDRLKSDLGIVAKRQTTNLNETQQFHLYIGPESYLLFINLIKPICNWSCFHYKHDLTDYKEQIYTSGELNGKSKLKYDQVLNIFTLTKEGLTQSEIGKILGVKQYTISRILSGKRWNRFIEMKEKSCPQ